jgi:hypothetical protein
VFIAAPEGNGLHFLTLARVVFFQKNSAFHILEHLLPSHNFCFSQDSFASIVVPVLQQF